MRKTEPLLEALFGAIHLGAQPRVASVPAFVYHANAPSCTMNRMNTNAQGCASSTPVSASRRAKEGCGSATRPTPNPSFKRTRLRRSA